jgi:acyl carrier protein
MNREELKQKLLVLVTGIAPDVEASEVLPGVPLRDQFDFDSMDTLNYAIAIHRELGVDVPEADYSKLASLDSAADYLLARLGKRAG